MKPGEKPGAVASAELEEETSLAIPENRFRYIGLRQIAATLSAHRAHVYAVELTPEEMLSLRWSANTAHGNHEDSEYTFTHIASVQDLLVGDSSVDWSNLGMVFQALSSRR
jgi:hypothetical protein